MELISKHLVIGLAVIVLLMAGYIAWLSVVNATQKTEIVTLKADKATYENANNELKASIEKRDSEMAKMRKQAAERAAQVARDKVKASILNKRYESIADNIAKLKAPTKNDCQNAQVLLKNYLRGSK